MTTFKIDRRHVDKFKNHYPLLYKEALIGGHLLEDPSLTEGTLLQLTDESGNYVATAYFGRQNKGVGWVISFNKREAIDGTFFKSKLYQAFEKRLGLYNNPKTNAFRVFNGEGDGIGGFTIDFYAGYYLITWYNRGIYIYRDTIIEALKATAEYDGIYEKNRISFSPGETPFEEGLVAGSPAQFPLVVSENGVKLAAHFEDGAMVGFFTDQREVRKAIRNQYAKGKTVLNTFSYTGAFSVFAALGGAKKTTSVDLANRSHEKTLENFKLNGIDPAKHEIIVDDVFLFFKYAYKKGQLYDVVILDPPSFAKSKTGTFSAEKDYASLVQDAIQLTENGGLLIASNNSATIDLDKFKRLVEKGVQEAKAQATVVETFRLPRDFRYNHNYEEGNYLKVLFLRIKK